MKKIFATVFVSLFMALSIPLAQAGAAPYCNITWGSLPKSGGIMSTAPLNNIRTGQHDCYDRMVFDFSGAAAGYRVEYVSNIYADPSGQLIPLAGGAKLQIVALAPSYDSAGHSTYPGVTGQRLPGVNLTGYQTFREAKFGGSFEGQTLVGLGVRARLPFRARSAQRKLSKFVPILNLHLFLGTCKVSLVA